MSQDNNESNIEPAKTPDEIHKDALAGVMKHWKTGQIDFKQFLALKAHADIVYQLSGGSTGEVEITHEVLMDVFHRALNRYHPSLRITHDFSSFDFTASLVTAAHPKRTWVIIIEKRPYDSNSE